mgnify:CR=1 FL=1|jgi:hypothetical protein
MIAVEVFAVLVVIGLIAVIVLQKFGNGKPRRRKGDAVKSPEEMKSHTPGAGS